MNRQDHEFKKRIEAAREAATEPGREVLEHLYQSILTLPAFALKDGTRARLDPFINPEVDHDGKIHCGFDVLLDNGSHLEFTVTNTGFGRGFAQRHEGDASGESRTR